MPQVHRAENRRATEAKEFPCIRQGKEDGKAGGCANKDRCSFIRVYVHSLSRQRTNQEIELGALSLRTPFVLARFKEPRAVWAEQKLCFRHLKKDGENEGLTAAEFGRIGFTAAEFGGIGLTGAEFGGMGLQPQSLAGLGLPKTAGLGLQPERWDYGSV